jgi:hypothetical protein
MNGERSTMFDATTTLTFTKGRLAAIHTEWKRRYDDDPDSFADWGDDPDYGAACVEFIEKLDQEMGYVDHELHHDAEDTLAHRSEYHDPPGSLQSHPHGGHTEHGT